MKHAAAPHKATRIPRDHLSGPVFPANSSPRWQADRRDVCKMTNMRPAPQCDNAAHDQLIERIADRYDQLEQALEQVEARLSEIDLPQARDAAAPRKPR